MQEVNSNPNPKPASGHNDLFRHLKRPLPYVGLLLTVLLLVFNQAIRDYTANFVGESLVNIVKNETAGSYSVSSDLAQFDIFTKELRIRQFSIKLDTTNHSPEEYLQDHPNLVNLSTPLLVLKIHSWFDLIFNKNLRIDFIGIEDPHVSIIKSGHYVVPTTEKSSVMSNLQGYLNTLEVDSFRIIKGQVALTNHLQDHSSEVDININEFSASIKNFRYGQESTLDLLEGLYADHLELDIVNQEVLLPGNKQVLTFKNLHLSSETSEFVLDTLAILPVDGIDANEKILIPQLRITGLDFEHAYRDNIIIMDSLTIYKPVVNINSDKPFIELEGSSDGPTINELLSGLELNSLNVTDGEFRIISASPLTVGDIDITLSKYKLDTMLMDLENLAGGLNGGNMTLQDISIDLPDSIHQLTIDDINVSLEDALLAVHGTKINPLPGRTRYNILKRRQVPLIQRTSIRDVTFNGLNYDLLLINQQLEATDILINRPLTYLLHYPNLTGPKSSSNPVGFLQQIDNLGVNNGYIQLNQIKSGINSTSVLSAIYANISNLTPTNLSEQDTVASKTLYFAGLNFSGMQLDIDSVSTQIGAIGHTATLNKLKIEDLTDLSINKLQLKPDSAKLAGNHYVVDASNFILKGFDEESLTQYDALFIDSITVGSLSASVQMKGQTKSNLESSPMMDQIVLGYFGIGDGNVSFRNQQIAASVNNIFGEAYHLEFDSLKSDKQSMYDFNDIFVQHGRYNFTNLGNNFRVFGTSGQFSEADSLIILNNINIRDGKKNLTSRTASVRMIGLDKTRLQDDLFLKFNEVTVESPKFTIKTQKDTSRVYKHISFEQLQNQLLNKLTGIDFDKLDVQNGTLTLQIANNRNIDLNNINSSIKNYYLDTLSQPELLFKPESFMLTAGELSSLTDRDTINIADISLNINSNELSTGTIDINALLGQNKLKVEAPGIQLAGFSPIKLMNRDYSLEYVRTKHALIRLSQLDERVDSTTVNLKSNYYQIINSIFSEANVSRKTDSLNLDLSIADVHFDSTGKSNLVDLLSTSRQDNQTVQEVLDSLGVTPADSVVYSNGVIVNADSSVIIPDSILVSTIEKVDSIEAISQTGITGLIQNIQMDSSVFDWTKNNDPNFPLRNTKFSISITNFLLDSLQKINIGENIEDISLSVTDHSIKLPDSLNTLHVGKFVVSTGASQVRINDIALRSRVGKYEYAGEVGHQVTWQNLEGLNVSIDSLDIPAFLNQQVISAHKVTVHDGMLNLFRDKQYPFPEDQRRGLPQAALRSLGTTVTIDSVEVENLNIEYRERQTSDRPEGFITIDNIAGRFGTITNDSAHLAFDDNIKGVASADLYNQGHLDINFDFHVNDPDNKFSWDLTFTAMPAGDFNNILEEAAYVSIASGNIKSISMTAEADNDYALGKMRFLYNDLKVSALNRKNMKTGGMGPGLLSFFANTFVVKKNNPNARVFVRTGDIYYERDEKRVIFDYMVKTALNGVVSSIGASSNRKELKKIKKENKNKVDEAKSKQKKLDKSAMKQLKKLEKTAKKQSKKVN